MNRLSSEFFRPRPSFEHRSATYLCLRAKQYNVLKIQLQFITANHSRVLLFLIFDVPFKTSKKTYPLLDSSYVTWNPCDSFNISTPSNMLKFMFAPQIRTCIDPKTNCSFPHVPMGRFIHIPPRCPRTDWANDFGRPWWKDETYCIGVLSRKTRMIRIINTLTSQEQTIEVRT